eukprot:scaffold18075_cov83-Skeletonema_dohrnii-CCMP3373.AAC.3
MLAGNVAPPMKWCCINKHKNEPLTILFHCTWSGKEYPVPANAEHVDVENNYYDEPNGDDMDILIGSTTLKDSVKSFKAREPTLFLMEECGGIEMHCGNNTVCGSEWDMTMVCHLVYEQPENLIPRVTLDDGRHAVVITLGTKGDPLNKKPSVVSRVGGP